MPPSNKNDDGTGRIQFAEGGMRPSIMKLETVPETAEEKATRFTLRAIVITVIVVALVVAFITWRSWANAESRAEAVVAYDASYTDESAAQAIDLLESHGESSSELIAARIRMERAFEELTEVPEQPFDVNGAPSGAKIDAAIAETYRLLVRNQRAAAARMISAVRTSSPAALRARVRAALALGQFKYAAQALGAAPAKSDSPVRAELQAFANLMTKAANAPKVEGPYALTGELKAALAKGDRASVQSLSAKLEGVAITPRQKRWASLGRAYEAAYAQGAGATLSQLQSLQAKRISWSDVYAVAIADALLLAEAPRASQAEFAVLPATAQQWVGAKRILRARVFANLMLGHFGKAESELARLGKEPVDHVLRGWSAMARGRTQAAKRHFTMVGDQDPFFSRLAKLKQTDLALSANDREAANTLLASVSPNLPRWTVQVQIRQTLLNHAALVSRYSPPSNLAKPNDNDPYLSAQYADTVTADEAAGLYNAAIKRIAAMPHATLGLFEIAIRNGDSGKEWLKKMRFDHPHATRAVQAQGLLWLRDGEGARGSVKLGRLMTRYGMSDWPELRALRARLYAQSGEYVRAVREYARAAKLAEEQLDVWVQIMARKSIAHAELGAKGPAESVLEEIEEKVAEVGRDTLTKGSEALWTAARARHNLVDKKYVAAQLFAKRALKVDADLVEAQMVLVDFAIEKKRENLKALEAAANAPWPSYRAKRLLAEREPAEP